jgi:hypothetical protein
MKKKSNPPRQGAEDKGRPLYWSINPSRDDLGVNSRIRDLNLGSILYKAVNMATFSFAVNLIMVSAEVAAYTAWDASSMLMG